LLAAKSRERQHAWCAFVRRTRAKSSLIARAGAAQTFPTPQAKAACFEPTAVGCRGFQVTSGLALKMTSDLFWTGLLVSLPVLGLTVLVGLAISILQVLTQVQEMSLTVVPKLVTAGVAIVVFGPWMLRTLCQFAVQLWSQIPTLV
jgi:flagellar biosynthetic protein FliQ